jgi:hypothetical protein
MVAPPAQRDSPVDPARTDSPAGSEAGEPPPAESGDTPDEATGSPLDGTESGGEAGDAGPAEADGREPESIAEDVGSGDPKERARLEFQRAVDLASRGELAEAAAAFAASDAAFPSQNAAYNAAFAFEKASDWVSGMRRYRVYLERYPEGQYRREVEAAMGRLSGEVADLDVRVRGEGAGTAQVWVDGTRLGADALPVLREPGDVTVEIRDADGTVLQTRALVLYPGSANTVRIELVATRTPEEVAGPASGADEAPGTPEPARWPRSAAIAGGVITASAGIGLGVAGGSALQARQRFYDERCPNPCDGGSYPFAREREFLRARTAANVMVGVTAGAAVFTVAMIAIHVRNRRRAESAAGPAENPPRTSFRVESGGLALRF